MVPLKQRQDSRSTARSWADLSLEIPDKRAHPRNVVASADVYPVETMMGGSSMRNRAWVTVTLRVAVFALALTAAASAYLATRRFTYYNNGTWVQSNLLAVYAKSLAGYGRRPIDERRLGPDWGSWPHYAARNFTLDLLGLDYSVPLAWEDTASGAGLWVVRSQGSGRKEIALYSTGPRVAPGEKAVVKVQLVGEGGPSQTESGQVFAKTYSLTLYRPRFSSVAYVTEISETSPGMLAAGIGGYHPKKEEHHRPQHDTYFGQGGVAWTPGELWSCARRTHSGYKG